MDTHFKINNQITAPELRVIDESGENLGVLSLDAAKNAAADRGVDLILIVPNAAPPIARLMSYDKFRYIKEKELKKQRQAMKAPEMKQVQISAREAKNDLMVKIARTQKFIEAGHRVEIAMRLRGREKAMKDWAKTKMEEFFKLIPFQYKLTQTIQYDGKQFTARLDPVIK